MGELFIGCRNSDGIKNFVKSYDIYFPTAGNFTRTLEIQDCADECNKVTSCWAFRLDQQWSASRFAMVANVCHGYYNKESAAKIISSKNNKENYNGVVYVKCINGRYTTFLYEIFRGVVLNFIRCYVHIIHI